MGFGIKQMWVQPQICHLINMTLESYLIYLSSNVFIYTMSITKIPSSKIGCVALYQKNKQPNQKMGRRPKWTFLQRRQTDGQQAHEKMLNIRNY